MTTERTRAWRRKKTQSVWKRRLKEHIGMALIPSKEKEIIIMNGSGKMLVFPKSWRSPDTWKEFKNEVRWSRYLRDQGKISSDKSEQIDAHHKNKISRSLAKRNVGDGIDEYYDEYAEDDFANEFF